MVFHLLRSGWKHLGHFNHCQKEKITDNHKFVHSFFGGGRSVCISVWRINAITAFV